VLAKESRKGAYPMRQGEGPRGSMRERCGKGKSWGMKGKKTSAGLYIALRDGSETN